MIIAITTPIMLAIVILIESPNVITNNPKFRIIGLSRPKDCP